MPILEGSLIDGDDRRLDGVETVGSIEEDSQEGTIGGGGEVWIQDLREKITKIGRMKKKESARRRVVKI